MASRRRSSRDNNNVHPAGPFVQQLRLPPPFSLDDASLDTVPFTGEPVTIYTIGHSNYDAETFLGLLTAHGLQMLIDVRTAPYSRYVPHFSRAPLERLLDDARIGYVWAGDVLGGRPDDPACYDGNGAVDYEAIARQPWYQEGVELLLGLAGTAPTVMLCSEEDPRRCHRHRLIEPSLREREVVVLHIRRDGSLETIAPKLGKVELPSAQLAFMEFAA